MSVTKDLHIAVQPQAERRLLTPFQYLAAASLVLSAAVYFAVTWRWPLVGDASLMHYMAFLIERGWVPYRQLGDMNMPGSYLIEMAAMHIFGRGDLAWRLFDFFSMAAAAAAFHAVIPPPSKNSSVSPRWFSWMFCTSLFIVTHGRDGLAQGGQRDLTMAICLIGATAFLIHSIEKESVVYAAAFGLLSGMALTIKPTAPLLTIGQLVLAFYAIPRGRSQTRRSSIVLAAILAWIAAPLAVLAFLIHENALAAFIHTLRTFVPYYSSLGHRPLSFVLLHSLSPVLPLVIAWIAVLILLPSRADSLRDWHRTALLLGVGFGILNCIIQARALPYYRYPLLVFLLPLIAIDLTRALRFTHVTSPFRERAIQTVAGLGLVFGAFFLAPKSAYLIHRYRWWETDFITSLQQNLDTLGGPRLSNDILCVDTNAGCGNVLYRMRLEPATGVLSDFFLFGDSRVPAVQETREQLTSALATHPPQVIVVTSGLYLGGDADSDYRKLSRWPESANYLATHYTLNTEWHPTRQALWWSRPETPDSYRIYVLHAPGIPSADGRH